MDKRTELYVELADSPLKRQQGLQGRKSLGRNAGMLFKFPVSQQLRFWMKNTYVPLDIAFIDDDGTILEISEMIPLSTKEIRSNFPCRLALEVRRGWFKNNDVDVGTKVLGYGITASSLYPIRQAQASLPTPQDYDNPNPPPAELTGASEHPEQPIQEADPNVTVNMSKEDIIEYANRFSKGMTIVYQPEDSNITQVKHLLPTEDGYLLERGKNGQIVRAFDDSPTITGPDWESTGKQVKSFLIDNIISLELDK